ncbi:V-set and immunoglobulin domain-containing protein 10 [Diretmus argenteus]
MKVRVTTTTAAFLHLCVCVTAAVSGKGSGGETAFAAPGDTALLPCYSVGNVTPSVTRWMKNGREVVSRGRGQSAASSSVSAGKRFAILDDGSLRVHVVTPGDEGIYLCNSTVLNNTVQTSVQLLLAGGPENVSTSISAAIVLPNGTLVAFRGRTVTFNCSGSSYPSQILTWSFTGASSTNYSLVSGGGSWLDFRIEDIQPGAQGEYSCRAHNSLSHRAANRSTQLLVYWMMGSGKDVTAAISLSSIVTVARCCVLYVSYASDRHPECRWRPGVDPSHVQFSCTWLGAYPTPTLHWTENHHGAGTDLEGHFFTEVTDSLVVMMNRSTLYEGQTVKCIAEHPTLTPGQEKTCLFSLKSPFPEGDPLVTALEATNVTLTCTEDRSLPLANTTWRKGNLQEVIVPGSKYVVSEDGPVFRLTIVNVSKDDQGVYFCRSENPLAVCELEVYLTVKASSAYTGAIIGIFLAALIVGSAVIIARIAYSSRDRICLGNVFCLRMEEDRGDVLSLVESDDEQIFHDAVPRLPPLTNGNHTTLVQIHRIPSSDHEDADTADTSPRQQGDTVQTEGEPADLVTF